MIKGRGGQALKPFFWAVAWAKTATKFAYHMQKLRDISPSAADYLRSIDSHLYVEAFVPQTRFGHDISNIVESMNAVLKMDRQVDIMELLSRIWDRVMSMRFNRFSAASQLLFQDGHTWTPYCAQLLRTSREFAGGCRIQMSTLHEANVRTPTDKVYRVTLDREAKGCICSCKRPQQKLVPCGHVLAVLLDQKIEIASFMPSCYEVHTWYRQYTKPMPVVISWTSLFKDAVIHQILVCLEVDLERSECDRVAFEVVEHWQEMKLIKNFCMNLQCIETALIVLLVVWLDITEQRVGGVILIFFLVSAYVVYFT